MSVGISSACLYPETTENAIKTLASMGIGAIEIFLNARCETEYPLLGEIKDGVLHSGLKIKAVHTFTPPVESFLFFSNYQRRFDEGMELIKKMFSAASEIGAKKLIFHGDKSHIIPDEQYFERYAKIYAEGKKYGVTFTQENVFKFRSQTPDFIRKMRDYLSDECAFTLDVKQCRRANCDPFDMAQAMGKSLIHLHLSDELEGKDCVLPGTGTFDFEKLIELNENTRCADKIIEVYRSCYDDYEQLIDAYKYIKKFEHR